MTAIENLRELNKEADNRVIDEDDRICFLYAAVDAILELAEQVKKEHNRISEIYEHHEARFRVVAERIDELQERCDVHKDSIKQNNNAICHILTKPEKSKWVWNQHKYVKINIETGLAFHLNEDSTGVCVFYADWTMGKFATEDEARAYIDEVTEGI